MFLYQDLRHGEQTNTVKLVSYFSFIIFQWAAWREGCEQDGSRAGASRAFKPGLLRIPTKAEGVRLERNWWGPEILN